MSKLKALAVAMHKLAAAQIKARIEEANRNEDDDFVRDTDVLHEKESAPVCKHEAELIEYIQNFKFTRKITHAFVHCTASRPDASVSSIQAHWRRKGWKNDGYHIILPTEGFTLLVDFNSVSNGVLGYNSTGLHISYIGGVKLDNGKWKPLDNRTESQKKLIEIFLREIKLRIPNIKIAGHNEAAKKACPSFKVKDEYPEYWTGI